MHAQGDHQLANSSYSLQVHVTLIIDNLIKKPS